MPSTGMRVSSLLIGCEKTRILQDLQVLSLLIGCWEFEHAQNLKFVKLLWQTRRLKRTNNCEIGGLKISGGSSVSQNKLLQLIIGYIYILKYLQSNFIG